jgi:tight adherence protein C
MILFIKLLAFAAGALGVIGVFVLFFGGRREKEYANNLPFCFRILQTETKFLSRTLGMEITAQMPSLDRYWRNQILLSGLKLEVADIFGSRILWCILFSVGGAGVTISVTDSALYLVGAAVVCAFLGYSYPSMAIQKAAEERQKTLRKNLPFAIDLITSAMRAGLDFMASVRYYVTNTEPGPLTQEFGQVLKETELGKSRIEALHSMSERIQLDEFKSLVTAVSEGAEMGASIVDTLSVHAEEIRRARFAAAERQAQRAPSLIILPMILFIMPSVFIIIFTPVFLRVKDSGFSQMF